MSAGVPRAPDEIELRNIIDKLAGFVARNGPEFERMTKEKQKDNPKFGFLYGGEYYNYYMYKVTSEQAVMRKQQITDSAMNPNVSYQGHHNPVPQQPYHGGGGNQFQYQQQRPGGPPPVLHSGPPGQQPGNIPPTMSTQPQPLFGPPSGGIQQQQLHRQGLPPPQSQAGPPGGSMQMPPNTMPGALQSQQMPGQFPMSSSSQMPTPANSFMAHGSGLPPPSSRGDIGGTPGAPGLMANPVVSSGATGPGQPMGLSSLMNPPGGGSLLGGGMPAATTASTPPQSAPTLPGNPALDALTKQITESESNLKAQYEVLMQQQDLQIEEAIWAAETAENGNMGKEAGIDLDDFTTKLNALSECCTKEGIANGKNWMLTNNTSQEIGQLILNHLLHKIKHPDTSFTFRLHLLYLLNDLLHHGLRKNVIGLMGLLREFGARLYCFAYQSAEDDGQKEKLHKLVSLWEKNQYFDAATLAKLKDPAATREEVKKGLTVKRAGIATQIATTIQSTYTGYENQHKEFVKHIEQQIAALTKPSFASEQGSQQSTTRKSR